MSVCTHVSVCVYVMKGTDKSRVLSDILAETQTCKFYPKWPRVRVTILQGPLHMGWVWFCVCLSNPFLLSCTIDVMYGWGYGALVILLIRVCIGPFQWLGTSVVLHGAITLSACVGLFSCDQLHGGVHSCQEHRGDESQMQNTIILISTGGKLTLATSQMQVEFGCILKVCLLHLVVFYSKKSIRVSKIMKVAGDFWNLPAMVASEHMVIFLPCIWSTKQIKENWNDLCWLKYWQTKLTLRKCASPESLHELLHLDKGTL